MIHNSFDLFSTFSSNATAMVLNNYWLIVSDIGKLHICTPDIISIYYQYNDEKARNTFNGNIVQNNENKKKIYIHNKDLNKTSRDSFSVTSKVRFSSFMNLEPIPDVAKKIKFDLTSLTETTSTVEYKSHSQIIQAIVCLAREKNKDTFTTSEVFEKALELKIEHFNQPLQELIVAGQINRRFNNLSASPILVFQLMRTINRINKKKKI